jgi:hypothetical protein
MRDDNDRKQKSKERRKRSVGGAPNEEPKLLA